MMNKPINILLIVLMGLAAAGSERTRALEIERERLSRQIDSLEAVEPVQLPPKIITVVKKVPVPETWWLSPNPDTIVDTIFSGWIDVEVDSLKHQ